MKIKIQFYQHILLLGRLGEDFNHHGRGTCINALFINVFGITNHNNVRLDNIPAAFLGQRTSKGAVRGLHFLPLKKLYMVVMISTIML